nr:hypothetical protein [Sphingomonas jeddahensis]
MALALLLAACGQPAPDPARPEEAGAALEQAALKAGIVADPANLNPVGAYASETDRVCIVPHNKDYRIGASVEYGEGQSCIARGVASGRDTLQIDFGEDCRFEAGVEGGRVVFPAVLPPACDRRCTGRATLTAINASLLSSAEAEARAMRAPDGEPLCS